MADGCRITPGPLLRSGQPGRGSKQALSGSRSGGSRSSVAGFGGGGSRSSVAGYGGGSMMRDGPLRPPPGFVSYQIPNGVLPQPPPPSDNINMYDARRFMSVGSLMSGRHVVSSSAAQKQQYNGGYYPRYSRQSSGGAATDGRSCITAREPPTTAGVYPAHLHNGGRSFGNNNGAAEAAEREKSYWSMQRGRPRQPDVYQPPPWAGERLIDAPLMRDRDTAVHDDADSPPSRRYPRSPMPAVRSSDLALVDDPRCRPPLPGAIPRPPPRSRPRSWTSTLFNAMRNGTASLSKKNGNNASSTLPPQAQGEREAEYYEEYMLEPDPYYGSQYNNSSSTPGSVGVMAGGTLDKRGSSKQVRFLANPSKPPPEAAHPRFYSLPRFILPMGGGEGRSSGGRRSSHLLQAVGGEEKNGGSGGDAAKIKMMRSRTPSPFGRFVKSLVRGKKKNKCSEIGKMSRIAA
jgi:hypothetical protein